MYVYTITSGVTGDRKEMKGGSGNGGTGRGKERDRVRRSTDIVDFCAHSTSLYAILQTKLTEIVSDDRVGVATMH